MAPARTSWKGYLRLSLVSVPVKAYTAHDTSETIRLNQLHKECHNRVRYQKVCPEHGELKQKDIISGYEYAKDQYVVIDPQEVSKLRQESDKGVHIRGFVETGSIDSIYAAGKSYYLLPDGVAGKKPYALLTTVMREDDVVAVGQVVMAGREQLVALRPMGDLLVMQVLHYAQELKPSRPFEDEIEGQKLADDELSLTRTLVGASTRQDFDLESLRDHYVDDLKQLIEMKIEGQEVVQVPDVEEPRILNLMDALKASVAAAKSGEPAPAQGNGEAAQPARRKAGGSKKKAGEAAERKMAPSAKAKSSKKKASRRKSG